MHTVMVIGAGKIGLCVAHQFARSGQYQVHLVDKVISAAHQALFSFVQELHFHQHDISDEKGMDAFIKKYEPIALISALPYFMNPALARVAKRHHLHYFDLTEDRQTSAEIQRIAEGQSTAFVPQCGLAPGWVGMIAYALMQDFEQVQSVKLRVGALPQHSHHPLKYALTWSTDGLINEYANACEALADGKVIERQALEGLETLEFDGAIYEAFNTSGGLGHLVKLCKDKVQDLDYKTIRYPDHAEKMQFLMQGMHLNQNRELLKNLLEHSVPTTTQDEVLLYVSVTGLKDGKLVEENVFKRLYPLLQGEISWTAIQWTTATSLCGVVDIILAAPERYQGFINQETLSLSAFKENQFGALLYESQGDKQLS